MLKVIDKIKYFYKKLSFDISCSCKMRGLSKKYKMISLGKYCFPRVLLTANKLKPKIIINASLVYGIDDAAFTAILYGLLCNIPNLLYLILNIIFKVKKLSLDIEPKFNKTLLTFGITSIFYFNIANIIYILFLLFKSKEIKEVAPNLGRDI